MLEYLHAPSLPEPFSFFLLSQLATVPLLVFSVQFGQGLFLKYVAFFWSLHSFTAHACRINRRLLLLLSYCYCLRTDQRRLRNDRWRNDSLAKRPTFFNAAVFSVKSKRSYSPQRMLPFSRMFTFCWINSRPCKHLGTAPSLVKIFSFKYFRESSHLKLDYE